MISSQDPNYHSASDLLAAALEAQTHLTTLINELQSTTPPSISSISTRRPLLRSTQRLHRALQSPFEAFIDYYHQSYHHSALNAATRLRILDNIGALGGEGVSEIEVSEKTGQTAETVRRLLKVLATDVGFVEEVEDGKWRRLRIGECGMLPPASGLGVIHAFNM